MRMVAWWHTWSHGRHGDAQSITEKPCPGTNKAWPSLPKDPTVGCVMPSCWQKVIHF